jgi:predicted nucleotidyltransferase
MSSGYFGLSSAVIEQIHTVLRRYPDVERAIIYGSRALGTYKPGSDIDLALVGGESLDLSTVYRILDDLDELLLPYTFDIVALSHVRDASFLDHIRQVGKVFYERTEPAEPAPLSSQEPDADSAPHSNLNDAIARSKTGL